MPDRPYHIQGRRVPADLKGPMVPMMAGLEDEQLLSDVLEVEGYLYLPGILDSSDVLAARQEVFGNLAEVGEIQSPVMEGIQTGCSSRAEQHDDLGLFWSQVSNGRRLRTVTHGETLARIMEAILRQPARPHDLMYLRPMAPGKATSLHYDLPFFAGFSSSILTAWIPLGDVAVEEGPLVVVEHSHNFSDLLDPIQQHDYQGDRSNETIQQAAYNSEMQLHPVDLAQERGVRLLSGDFAAGDLVVFCMQLMHGSLDNDSPKGRVRLSCDVRYQPAADSSEDARYFGAEPRGSKGGGYGDMRGAQPLVDGPS